LSTWLGLVIADAVAVTTLARCFSGPGELTAALVTLIVVHLAGLLARQKVGGHGTGWWALALALALLAPMAFVLGGTFFEGIPGRATWHGIETDLPAAWAAFRFRLAPVPELPGLVLATAWASGLAGLVSEVLFSRRRLAAGFALVPALGIYLFASALGTSSGRVLGLVAMAGSACWYLVSAVSEREGDRQGVVASLDSAISDGRTRIHGTGRVILPIALLAGVAAGVVGPYLPGGSSGALVAWHATGGAGAGATSLSTGSSPTPRIFVSTLVQVAEEEVDDPSLPLFTVHSSRPTRELLAALDDFNGNTWTAPPGPTTRPGFLSASPTAEERQPPQPRADGPGHEILVQVFDVADLGGFDVPTWGYATAMAGAGRVTRNGPGGSIVSRQALRPGAVYAVSSVVADPSPGELEAASVDLSDPSYLQLPSTVPSRLVRLADDLVAGATTPYDKALRLEDYLTSQKFRYRLPARTASGVAAPAPGYGELSQFLFQSHTGYCQQFATAFAVLARLAGLPTRLAVGFLPGHSVGHEQWQVDGDDTHVWPQVRFEDYGWIDFEPTPGTAVQGSSAPGPSGPTTSTVVPVTQTTSAGHATAPSSPAGGATNGGGAGSRGRHRGLLLRLWFLLVASFLVAAVAGLLMWRRLRLKAVVREPGTEILSAWSEASRTLELAGIRRRRGETFLELADRARTTGLLSGEAAAALADLAGLATIVCYSGSPPGLEGKDRARKDATTVIQSARLKVPRWQRIAAVIDPRGLLA
jgi:transglutaminase-like putative cysteine protease